MQLPADVSTLQKRQFADQGAGPGDLLKTDAGNWRIHNDQPTAYMQWHRVTLPDTGFAVYAARTGNRQRDCNLVEGFKDDTVVVAGTVSDGVGSTAHGRWFAAIAMIAGAFLPSAVLRASGLNGRVNSTLMRWAPR